MYIKTNTWNILIKRKSYKVCNIMGLITWKILDYSLVAMLASFQMKLYMKLDFSFFAHNKLARDSTEYHSNVFISYVTKLVPSKLFIKKENMNK